MAPKKGAKKKKKAKAKQKKQQGAGSKAEDRTEETQVTLSSSASSSAPSQPVTDSDVREERKGEERSRGEAETATQSSLYGETIRKLLEKPVIPHCFGCNIKLNTPALLRCPSCSIGVFCSSLCMSNAENHPYCHIFAAATQTREKLEKNSKLDLFQRWKKAATKCLLLLFDVLRVTSTQALPHLACVDWTQFCHKNVKLVCDVKHVLLSTGYSLSRAGRFGEAVTLYQQCIAIERKVFPGETADYDTAVRQIEDILLEYGRHADTIQKKESVLRRTRRQKEADSLVGAEETVGSEPDEETRGGESLAREGDTRGVPGLWVEGVIVMAESYSVQLRDECDDVVYRTRGRAEGGGATKEELLMAPPPASLDTVD